ncbi:MAG: ABC transporter ATP-binding protein [Ruminococcus sp.]|nr:ABC transporter ATP-binding protein [Ruminococcus sp.]
MEIEIRNIKKKYKSKEVLKDINLTVKSGKCIGILGANGTGKSTLLSILAGIQSADAGEFNFDGNNLFKYTKQRATLVGYVPQGTPLIEELSAKDNLLLWYKKSDMEKELKNGVLKMLGINEFLKAPVSKMSGGMKKRLSIGCAIYNHPPVLLLDEPMAALDLACKQNISEYIEKHKENGGIALLATHDVLELKLCDEWYIIKDGILIPFDYTGNVKELVEKL